MTLDQAIKLLRIKPPEPLTEESFRLFIKEANKAWKRLMVANHPDRGGSHDVALDLNEAWDRIKNCHISDFGSVNIYKSISTLKKKYPGPATSEHVEHFEKVRQEILKEIQKNIFGDFIIKPGPKKAKTKEEKLWEEILESKPDSGTHT